jgi:hypothetical protein
MAHPVRPITKLIDGERDATSQIISCADNLRVVHSATVRDALRQRRHHDAAAIFVLNLLPAGLLIAQLVHHQRVLLDASLGTLLAFAASGQAFLSTAVPGSAGFPAMKAVRAN